MTRASHRIAPRPLGLALEALADRVAPATALARIQASWAAAVGDTIAAAARPTGERDGLLTVTCEASVWAAELELMGPEVVSAINAALGDPVVRELRCRTGAGPG